MRTLVVIENPKRWPIALRNAEVVSAREYLLNSDYADLRRATVFNFCRTYEYQGLGYYVSLLAVARGHRPMPSVATIQSLRIGAVVRTIGDELDVVIQRALRPLRSDRFELSIYFGRNLTRRYDRLSQALFNQFPAPFLRAVFRRDRRGRWILDAVGIIATADIPDAHRDFVVDRVHAYFARPYRRGSRPRTSRYDLAILWREDDPTPPSDERAIRRFLRAAATVDIRADVIGPDDIGRLGTYDALFIRETTAVEHHTFRFARRAAAEGLVVVDDPESIIRCTNKVYQAELFQRHRIPSPGTWIVHSENVDVVAKAIAFPCVVKVPDSSFSQGVLRVEDPVMYRDVLEDLFTQTDLVVVQDFVPTAYDWRIGVLGGRPLYACRYHMARGHWQIIHNRERGTRYGAVEQVALADVPGDVLTMAVNVANLVGRGLYGVDLKVGAGGPLVIEINDNPSIEAGYEDRIEGDTLYRQVMAWFRRELDRVRGMS